jgi:hypothetical protein
MVHAGVQQRDSSLLAAATAFSESLRRRAYPVCFPIADIGHCAQLSDELVREEALVSRLQATLALDPVRFEEEYDAVLADSDRMDLGNPERALESFGIPRLLHGCRSVDRGVRAVEAVRHKFSSVQMRRECMRTLADGVAAFDEAVIKRALEMAAAMEAQWGDILDSDMRAQAAEVRRAL